jgi:hypothetical protein
LSDAIEHRLANIQDPCTGKKALPQRRKFERQPIARGVDILLYPPELNKCRHDPMRTALLKAELVRDIAQSHRFSLGGQALNYGE